MDLIVNHSELNNFCDNVSVQSDVLKEQIEIWKDKLQELEEIWKGEDASLFFENATSYIKRLDVIPNCYDSLDSFILGANREYRNADMEFKKEIEKQSIDFDSTKNGDKYA